MTTIWKYKLETTDEQIIIMPEGSEILTLQVQDDDPYIWVFVPITENVTEKRYFKIYGTGNPIISNSPHKYIGTYQLRGGLLVFHVYEYYPI